MSLYGSLIELYREGAGNFSQNHSQSKEGIISRDQSLLKQDVPPLFFSLIIELHLIPTKYRTYLNIIEFPFSENPVIAFFVQVLDSLTLLLTHSSLRGSQDSLETVVNLLVDLASMERSQLIRLNNSRHFGTADLAVR
jgi:hypothetical protein